MSFDPTFQIGGPQLELLKTINLNKVGIEECRAIYEGIEDASEINNGK